MLNGEGPNLCKKNNLSAKARKDNGQLTVREIELGLDRGETRCTRAEVCR